MRDFSVNIIGLSKKAHLFEYELRDAFFEKYGTEVVSGGEFNAQVTLDKRETFIEADFKIDGKAHLICDRSLEPFDFPLHIDRKIVFKYGEEAQEISDEIIIITQDQDKLELGQFMYEFIVLAIPMKKIHPSLRTEDTDGENDDEGKLIYTSSTSTDDDEDDDGEIDPRWEQLKKLK